MIFPSGTHHIKEKKPWVGPLYKWQMTWILFIFVFGFGWVTVSFLKYFVDPFLRWYYTHSEWMSSWEFLDFQCPRMRSVVKKCLFVFLICDPGWYYVKCQSKINAVKALLVMVVVVATMMISFDTMAKLFVSCNIRGKNAQKCDLHMRDSIQITEYMCPSISHALHMGHSWGGPMLESMALRVMSANSSGELHD